MKARLFALFFVLSFVIIATPIMAQDFPGAGSTCTTNPKDGSGLPVCGSSHDNACYTGGSMAGRCDNGFHADGSVTPAEIDWAWRCGWYVARYSDGTIPRSRVPSDCGSVLPGPTCQIDLTSVGYRVISINMAVLNPFGAWWDNDGKHPDIELTSDGYTWAWHNGPDSYDLGFDFQEWDGPDIHVYNTSSGWEYPVEGPCDVNASALPTS